MNKIDLSDLIEQMCERLGVNYDRTAEIVLDPGSAKVTVFKHRDDAYTREPPSVRSDVPDLPHCERVTFAIQS
jgi:hypothetical protein